MTTDNGYLPGFLERCTAWLNAEGVAGQVVAVQADSSEWEGNTEDGFRDSLYLYVHYVVDDVRRMREVGAIEQERLWRAVMGAVNG